LRPGMYVVREYELSVLSDSSFAPPIDFESKFGRYTQRSHWTAPAHREPLCPRSVVYHQDDRRVVRLRSRPGPFWLETLVRRDSAPAVLVSYGYPAPRELPDSSTPNGAARRAEIAKLDSLFAVWADEVAKSVSSPGAEPVLPPRRVLHRYDSGLLPDKAALDSICNGH
jgi:hypothetical protein